MGVSLAFFLSRVETGKSPALALVCMIISGLFKNNLIGIPIAALIWLYLRDKRNFIFGVLLSSLVTIIAIGACIAIFGTNFFDQMTASRIFRISRALGFMNRLQYFIPALVFWGVWARTNSTSRATSFSAIFLAVTFVTAILQKCGEGVALNALFEFLFATGVAAALCFDGIGKTWFGRKLGFKGAKIVLLLVLGLRITLTENLAPFRVLTSPQFHGEAQVNTVAFNREVERVASIPGPVSCSIMTVCYRAKKPFVFNSFWTSQFVATGRLTSEGVQKLADSQGIRFEINPPAAQWQDRKW